MKSEAGQMVDMYEKTQRLKEAASSGDPEAVTDPVFVKDFE